MARDKMGATGPVGDDRGWARVRCETMWLATIVAMLLSDAAPARAGTYAAFSKVGHSGGFVR